MIWKLETRKLSWRSPKKMAPVKKELQVMRADIGVLNQKAQGKDKKEIRAENTEA